MREAYRRWRETMREGGDRVTHTQIYRERKGGGKHRYTHTQRERERDGLVIEREREWWREG